MVWLVRIVLAALLLCAGGSLAVSYIPLTVAKKHIDGLATNRSQGLTEERFTLIRERSGLAAGVFFFAAAILFTYRRQIKPLSQNERRQFGNRWKQSLATFTQDPWTLWPFLALFGLGLAFRLLEVSRPVRYDEAYTYISYAMHPLHRALSNYSAPNNHLFHTFLVFLSTNLFGNNLMALRLPALAGGLLVMPAVFTTTTALYNRHAAIAATALVACSPPFIEYSVNARGYSWQICFLLGMVCFATRIARQEEHRLDWIGLVLTAVGAIYTIPTGVVPCACILSWILVIRWSQDGPSGLVFCVKQMTPAFLSIMALSGLLYLPPLLFSGPQQIIGNQFIQPMGKAQFMTHMPALAKMTWVRWNDGVPLAVQLSILLGFSVGIIVHRKIGRTPAPLTLWMSLLCAAFMVYRTTFGYSRVWLYLWVFVLITAGSGIAFLVPRRSLLAGLAVVLVGVTGISVHRQEVFLWSLETGNVPGIEEAAEWIHQNLGPGDRVVSSLLCNPTLTYLVHQKWPTLDHQLEPGPAARRIVAVIDMQPEIDSGKAVSSKSWVLRAGAPAVVMFAEHDRSQYSEPRLLQEWRGVMIWEAWHISVNSQARH